MYRKGQASLEQMVITGIGIGFIAVIFYLSLNFANDNVRISQAQDAVDKLAKSADYVYSLGPGTKDKVEVYMPDGIIFANLSSHTIHIRISLSSGRADVFANTKAALTGSLPQNSGPQEIIITHTEGGNIFFGESYLSCSPNSITKSFEQGDSGTDSIAITNVGSFQLTSISAAQSGNLDDILSISQPGATLNPGSSDTVGLSFSVAADETPGTYSGRVTVTASNSSECSASVTVFVISEGGEDAQGPVVTYITHAPANATSTDEITITAIGSDSTTGGNTISSCEIETDYSGIWNAMGSSDGSFDEVTEEATKNIGTLETGGHTVRVRCTDSIGNLGSPSVYSFTVDSATGGPLDDNQGPVVTHIVHTPLNASTITEVAIYAIGNDSTTGGNTITNCELELDDAGTWDAMSAVDGSFDEITENVTLDLFNLSFGAHNVRIRCNDSEGNQGNPSTYGFFVYMPGGGVGAIYNIIFISTAETSGGTTGEAKWINWLYVYSVENELIWNIDVFTRSEVKDGTAAIADYNIVIMSEAPNTDASLYSILNSYTASGHYIILAGNAMRNGPANLGLATGTGTAKSGDDIKIQVAHDITNGYTVGTGYAILTSAQNMYYHDSHTGTNIATWENYNNRGVIIEGGNVLTFGVIDPIYMNSNGDTIFGQLMEYALVNSG